MVSTPRSAAAMRTVCSETLRTAATAIGIEEPCPKAVRQHGSAPIGPCAPGTRRFRGSVGDGRTPPAGVRSVRGEGLSYGETPHAAIALASPRLSVVLWRKDNGASRPASEIPSLTFRSRALSFASDHVTTVAATQVVGRIGRRQRRPRLRRRQPRLRRVGREARSRSGDQLIARGSRAGLDLAGRPGWQGGRSPSPRGTTTLPSLADVGTPAVGQD